MSALTIEQIDKMTTQQIQALLSVKFKDSPYQYIIIPTAMSGYVKDIAMDTKNIFFVAPTSNKSGYEWIDEPGLTGNIKLIKALLEYNGKFEEAKLPSKGGSKRRMRRIRRKSRKNV